jgi:hypothetical protein
MILSVSELYNVDVKMVNEYEQLRVCCTWKGHELMLHAVGSMESKRNRLIIKATSNRVENQGLIPGRSSKFSLFCHLEHGTGAHTAFLSVEQTFFPQPLSDQSMKFMVLGHR